jgi:hypothetical protein
MQPRPAMAVRSLPCPSKPGRLWGVQKGKRGGGALGRVSWSSIRDPDMGLVAFSVLRIATYSVSPFSEAGAVGCSSAQRLGSRI